MPETPLFKMRLPLYLREAIEKQKGKKTYTAWIIEAIEAKLKKESNLKYDHHEINRYVDKKISI